MPVPKRNGIYFRDTCSSLTNCCYRVGWKMTRVAHNFAQTSGVSQFHSKVNCTRAPTPTLTFAFVRDNVSSATVHPRAANARPTREMCNCNRVQPCLQPFRSCTPFGTPVQPMVQKEHALFRTRIKEKPEHSIGWKSCAHAFETSLTSRKRECVRPSGAVAIFLLLRVQSQQSKREATHTITHTNTTISWK